MLGETVDVGKERYGMNWPGKADCFKAIQAPSLGTLRPCRGESINFDTSENLIIEGDNLEVLKLFQKSYLGKVKTDLHRSRLTILETISSILTTIQSLFKPIWNTPDRSMRKARSSARIPKRKADSTLNG